MNGPITGSEVTPRLPRKEGKYHCHRHKGGCGVSSNLRKVKRVGKYVEIRCYNCNRLIRSILYSTLNKPAK